MLAHGFSTTITRRDIERCITLDYDLGPSRYGDGDERNVKTYASFRIWRNFPGDKWSDPKGYLDTGVVRDLAWAEKLNIEISNLITKARAVFAEADEHHAPEITKGEDIRPGDLIRWQGNSARTFITRVTKTQAIVDGSEPLGNGFTAATTTRVRIKYEPTAGLGCLHAPTGKRFKIYRPASGQDINTLTANLQ